MKSNVLTKPMVAKTMRTMGIVAGIMLLLTGCDKLNLNLFNSTDFVTSGSADANIAKAVVGRGYDISGRFAQSEEIKESVLDFSQLVADQRIIKDGNIAQTEVTVKEGNTISEYQMSFDYAHTGKAGVDGLFSAEVGYNFGYDRAKRTDYSYATVSSYTSKYGMYIDGRKTPDVLSQYASATFLNHLSSMEMEDLIETYGTHVIVGGIWGASLDFSMSAQRKSVSNTFTFGAFVSAEATIEGISLGGSQEISSEFSNYYETSTKKFTINAKGGNSEHALSIITANTPEGRDAAYAAWVQTIDGNPAFCDYYKGGMVPIYEFVADEDAKAELKTAIEQYLDSRGIDAIELQEDVIEREFDLKDFCMNMGQGDSNVDADGHGDIKIEMTFELDIDMNNDLVLLVEMKVHELKGDYTKIEGSIEHRLFTNKHISSIESNKTKYGFSIQEPFDPGNGQYIPLAIFPDFIHGEYKPPAWLATFSVCIDGSSKDDTHIIGVKGILRVPVTILP